MEGHLASSSANYYSVLFTMVSAVVLPIRSLLIVKDMANTCIPYLVTNFCRNPLLDGKVVQEIRKLPENDQRTLFSNTDEKYALS